jgi:replicative DNA helicase
MDLCLVAQLSAESFYVPAHRTIFDAMLSMSRDGRPIDALTVSDRLKTGGMLDSIGGPIFLDRLIDSTPTAAHAEYYIDIVRQKHLLRMIIENAVRVQAECYDSDEEADSILGRVEQSFFDITESQHGTVPRWPDVVKEAMGRVEQVFLHKKSLDALETGFRDLDQVLFGMRPSNLIILAARPGMGKTSLALNIVEKLVRGKGLPEERPVPVGIFSLEMSKEELSLRMICSLSEVSTSQISGGSISAASHRKIVQAADVLMKAPIFLDDSPGLDVLELRARARRMRRKYDIRLLVVDYLQLLHSREYSRQGRQVEISAVSGSLKSMAKELKIPVLVVSQLSRAPEGRETGKPKLSDLRESGSIEQDADVVLMLRRPRAYPEDPEHDDETLAILDVAKHRNGPCKEDIRLNFHTDITRFSDRVRGVDRPDAEYAPDAGGEP